MNIIKNRKIWFTGSISLTIISLLMIFLNPLKPAIDFSGGSLLEIKVNKQVAKDEISKIATESELENPQVTTSGQGSDTSQFLIRSQAISQDQKDKIIKNINSEVGEGKAQELRFETIGPTISADLVKKAILSVILASLGIIFYIAYAFRKMPDKNLSWRFGVSAVVALIHDLTITVGLFAIFAKFYNWEVDSLFITGLLTVMGFSVHDTIVVFDRLRENINNNIGQDFSETVNSSVTQTIARSINTSFTLIITMASLLLLGGTTLSAFVFVLLVGIIVGTYSSIFVASPLVVTWQNFTNRALKN